MSKNAIIDTDKPVLEMSDDNKVVMDYQVTNTEIKYGLLQLHHKE